MNYETNYEEQKFFNASFDLIQQIMGCGFETKNQSEKVSSMPGTFQMLPRHTIETFRIMINIKIYIIAHVYREMRQVLKFDMSSQI